MIWTLLAIKGPQIEVPYFYQNTELEAYLKRRGITFVSSLDDLDSQNERLREPIHRFLRGFYPFYRNSPLYDTHQNHLVDGIIKNIKNPEYLNFLFQELGVTGENGPYILVFHDDVLKVKYMGSGGWNAYAVHQYLIDDLVYPPEKWEEDPTVPKPRFLFQQDLPASDFNIPAHQRVNVPLDAKEDVVSSLKNEGNEGEVAHSLIEPKPSWEQIESEFHEHYGHIPEDAIRLIHMIREHRLELGFQQLLQIIQLKNNPQLMVTALPSPPEHILLHVSSNFELAFKPELGELSLEPLHKALYLLFLQHHEGIELYDLHVYKSQLLQIYKGLSVSEDIQHISNAVERLCNRMDNSIYEKISRINGRLKKLFTEHQYDASAFLIMGKRGEKKVVLASRDLVRWP